MSLADKQELVGQLSDRLQRARACLVAEYQGLTVAELTKLRRSLDAFDAEFKIAKNRLVKIALNDNYQPLREHLVGPVGVAYFYGDLAPGIKQVLDFQKENEKFTVKAAVMGGSPVSPQELQAIANLPSREVLIGQLVGMIVAPHRQLLTVISGVPRALVLVLAALRDRKKE